MITHSRSVWVGLGVLSLAGTHASAQLNAVRFDDLPRGLVVTGELQARGVLVSGTAPSGLRPGQILDVTLGDLGVFNFGGSLNQAMLYGIVGDKLVLRLVDVQGAPVAHDFVALRIGDGDSTPESFRVSYFDVGGALLHADEYTTAGGPAAGGVNAWYDGSSNIHRVEVLGIGSFSGGAIDDLEFGTLPPCYADCDFSSYPRSLDIFDFLCFQNRFAQLDPYACECDTSTGPGVCDIFDFLCFQNAFVTGCP